MRGTGTGRNSSKTVAATIIAMLCLLGSCNSDRIYNQYQTVEDTIWDKDRIYYFTFNIKDASKPYDVIFEVRNNSLYPYRNLWVFASEEPPIGDISRDTVEFMLADDYGKWTGRGFSLYESSFVIRNKYRFPINGQYTFSFRQGMRTDCLSGIQEIGLRIERCADGK